MESASGPVAGVDYPRNYHEFVAWFPDDAACLRYLERLRWGQGRHVPLLRRCRGRVLADGRRAAPLCRVPA